MRALFVSTPGIGHLFPLVPLATAFRAAGHETLMVTFANGKKIADAGLHVVDVAPELDMATLFQRSAGAVDPALFERLRSGERINDISVVLPMFAGVNRPLIDDAVRLAESWRPDVVIFSQLTAAGALAAAKIGVPAVQVNFGFARTGNLQEDLAKHLADAYARHGVAGLPARLETLDVAPPSMIDGAPEGWPARYVPYNGGAVLEPWLLDRPERPRIAVTLGTVSPMMNGLGPVERIIEASSKLDAEVVLALGDTNLSTLGELPDTVRAAGWVPLGALLWNCAAVVHHGGAGTTLTALDAGVPQLVLPDGADRFINADAVARRGAGLSAKADEVDTALLERLLTGEALRAAAQEVRAEMATMPSPAALVPQLVDLAG